MTLLTLFSRSWWRYSATEAWGFGQAYHWFNIAEGTAWCIVGILTIRRYRIHRNSRLEVLYSLAFVAFGLSDFAEAHSLTTWLILLKGLNLLLLFVLRSYLLRRYYPGSKTY